MGKKTSKFGMMSTFEELLKNTDFRKNYTTDSKLFDFVPNDIVKCTLRKGYFKVRGFTGRKVLLANIENNDDLEVIGPEFLKKTNLDRRWVKVLYEEKE